MAASCNGLWNELAEENDMRPSVTTKASSCCPRAFTLIEVLVVVAIIALLISILLPSLRAARDIAKINMCKANAKQIATIMATYQAESKGYVPIIFNYGAEELKHHTTPTKFAGNALLSVALRNLEPGLKGLKGRKCFYDGSFFDPNTKWVSEKRQEYETKVMPQHYACPFGRDNGPARVIDEGTMPVRGPNTVVNYEFSRWEGRMNAYQVWQWEGQDVRGQIIPGEQYPTDPGPQVLGVRDGRPKFSVLSWCYRKLVPGKYPTGFKPGGEFVSSNSKDGDMLDPNSEVMTRYRQWKPQDAQRVGAASLSDVTVFYCMQGMSLGTGQQVRNNGSHRVGDKGGTNAAFADTHVEWVPGLQIGWQ
jgi:prepilin-type N-terminal cleavage/methylation domain-containing protein/prepilin-type processing-associated H-X9-DG protein